MSPVHRGNGPAPRLAPGVRVLERGRGQIQVGLDPRRALVLPDSSDLRDQLALLSAGTAASDADPAVLNLIRSHGLLRSAAPARLRLRLLEYGPPVPGITESLTRIGDLADTDADLVLVVGLGEPRRELLDPIVRAGRPHLVARITEGVAVLGPYVHPPDTACLRCVDAHHAAADPRWPLLVAQQAWHGEQDADPVVVDLLLAWLAADLLTVAAGGRPASWSATIRLPADLAGFDATTWWRHPHCGCGWDAPPIGGGRPQWSGE